MSGSTRSPRSARESDNDSVVDGDSVADVDAVVDGDCPARSAAERIRLDGEVPAAFERDLRSLSDVARNPLRRPLATVVAAVVVCTLAYQSYAVTVTAGPVAGVLTLTAAAVAYVVAKRLWAVQHRYVVAELAAADELDRLR